MYHWVELCSVFSTHPKSQVSCLHTITIVSMYQTIWVINKIWFFFGRQQFRFCKNRKLVLKNKNEFVTCIFYAYFWGSVSSWHLLKNWHYGGADQKRPKCQFFFESGAIFLTFWSFSAKSRGHYYQNHTFCPKFGHFAVFGKKSPKIQEKNRSKKLTFSGRG